MTIVNYINLFLELWGCTMTIIVTLCIRLSQYRRDLSTRLYFLMLYLNTGVLLFDAAALFFRGHTDVFSWWGVRLSNFTAFACNYLLMAAFMWYLTSYLEQRTKVSRRPMYFVLSLCVVSLALLVASQFVPFYYFFDAQNIYHRAPTFWLSQVTGILGMMACARLLVRYRKFLDSQETAGFWLYIVLPLAALCIQIFTYGVALLSIANSVSLTMIFLFLQAEQGRRIAEQENQLTKNRISIMLSQIQPHFLYNTLTGISVLCDKDPKMAKKATLEFSDYLRGNLESLTNPCPVTFEKELSHVRLYLNLEKMRFQEKLNIVYDIQCTGFMLPALSVQPLVENSVKYGVGKKENGGTVTISSREYEHYFEVTVQDDGVGFDPYETQSDGRTHIGIDNVKSRLWIMCQSSLEVRAQKGRGTTVIITIPKGE